MSVKCVETQSSSTSPFCPSSSASSVSHSSFPRFSRKRCRCLLDRFFSCANKLVEFFSCSVKDPMASRMAFHDVGRYALERTISKHCRQLCVRQRPDDIVFARTRYWYVDLPILRHTFVFILVISIFSPLRWPQLLPLFCLTSLSFKQVLNPRPPPSVLESVNPVVMSSRRHWHHSGHRPASSASFGSHCIIMASFNPVSSL
jgi:hypothetical protein